MQLDRTGCQYHNLTGSLSTVQLAPDGRHCSVMQSPLDSAEQDKCLYVFNLSTQQLCFWCTLLGPPRWFPDGTVLAMLCGNSREAAVVQLLYVETLAVKCISGMHDNATPHASFWNFVDVAGSKDHGHFVSWVVDQSDTWGQH